MIIGSIPQAPIIKLSCISVLPRASNSKESLYRKQIIGGHSNLSYSPLSVY